MLKNFSKNIQVEEDISIAGFVPLTTIDYPDNLSAVIFCQGCPFNCHYCHNPNLISMSNNGKYKWHEIKNFLLKRQGLLDAVVFSGGEPTLQKNLIYVMQSIKELGYKIGIHTSGAYPKFLEKLLPYLNWVGMDIKAPFNKYENITTVPNSGNLALKSTKLLLKSGVACEFRTTVHPKLITEEQILQIAHNLKILGAKNYKLQRFRANGCNNEKLSEFTKNTISQDTLNMLSSMFLKFSFV